MPSPARLWLERSHRLGESILWHAARRRFYWIDLLDPALHEFDPDTGAVTSRILGLPPPIGAIAATTDPGRLMLAHRGGLSLLAIDTLELTPWCDPEAGRHGIIYNDMKADRWGRLWVGTSHERECEPRGALWCVTDARTWQLADAGFAIANGPAFSPDGATMYFNDSLNRQTLAYDIAAHDARAARRRVLATYSEEEGMPDGLTVDAEGGIWSAQWAGAGIIRLSPAGEKLAHHGVAAGHVTSLCLAGPGLTTLHLTTARDGLAEAGLLAYPLSGSLFTLAVKVPGLPEPLVRL